jgi:hypothetical protein
MIVEDRTKGAIVGTYRMQMGEVAGQHFGYYCEQEFCFAPYESMRSQIVELGRACIDRAYRSSNVLHLLWRGIARYALVNCGRYMMGCCSLTSQDAEMGHAVYETLRDCMVGPELRTVATAAFALPVATATVPDVKAPKLLPRVTGIRMNELRMPALLTSSGRPGVLLARAAGRRGPPRRRNREGGTGEGANDHRRDQRAPLFARSCAQSTGARLADRGAFARMALLV